MRISKALTNERGAALILTLFLIMFISIVGVALLNTTFYGQNNNVVAVKEQKEYYPLEGAIEMMLFEMKEYERNSDSYLMSIDSVGNEKPVVDKEGNRYRIINKGAYFYINDMTAPRKFKIGNEYIEVSITKDPLNEDKYTISAKRDSLDSKLVRSLDIVVNREPQPEISIDPEVPEVKPFPVGKALLTTTNGLTDVHSKQIDKVGIIDGNFDDILRYYGVDLNPKGRPLTNDYKFDGKDKHYFDSVNVGSSFEIPAGNLVYIKNLLAFSGQSDMVVNGLLFVEELDIRGNVNICGAIVTRSLIIKGASAKINEKTNGCNPGFDSEGTAGGYKAPSIEVTEDDRIWSSEIENITDMRTERE